MKERVDVLLVKKGLFDSREKAQRAVMAGMVYSENQRMDKPGSKIDSETELHIKGKVLPYVGRGGLKLEKALKVFPISVKDKIMLDIGASTGGFTDCALQNGAKQVYALDVGYNQLAWKLRQDERVVVMERTNFRYCTRDDFDKGIPEFATIDVSFISLTKILPTLSTILNENGDVVALIKPQFEAGKEDIGKKGIVRDSRIHKSVLKDILSFSESLGYRVEQVSFSPITGGDGNIEFLSHLIWNPKQVVKMENMEEVINQVVTQAHEELKK
ncbi:TlyA family rRNA (cytidine-2'-O)-methyltransferase [Terrilactibacillus sp. BCM23-1]|uniref:TlyA family rRNA (Cytidine-2'-O)-methyltransferase n=1 Tax=Terrilactibacillus tamarindi TaxID=2599694 RepID=A0A6N8CRA3_9BACI|nr:TlyA family RNA methyltransferase [Terrilactibacillus tamarindi]MTT32694.1 TlyA family rRNA (cytidine-2'-O)-methyltransferase [Terrilactibacillus tamarindi]